MTNSEFLAGAKAMRKAIEALAHEDDFVEVSLLDGTSFLRVYLHRVSGEEIRVATNIVSCVHHGSEALVKLAYKQLNETIEQG